MSTFHPIFPYIVIYFGDFCADLVNLVAGYFPAAANVDRAAAASSPHDPKIEMTTTLTSQDRNAIPPQPK